MSLAWPSSDVVPGGIIFTADKGATIVTDDLGAPHQLGGALHDLGVVGAVGAGAVIAGVVIELVLSHPSIDGVLSCPTTPLADDDVLAEGQTS
ncbi:hypothetical protein AAC387_Pa03g0063 [Persea americana]